jgi:nucleosome binding factor SPN SPT16 subunit
MKINITELKKNKGKVVIDDNEINNCTPDISQTDIDILASNAINLLMDKGEDNV